MAVTFTGTTYLSTTSVPGGLNQNTSAHTFACWVYATNNSGSIIGGSTNTSCFVGVVGSATSGSGFQDCSWIGAYEPNDLVNWDQEANNFGEEVYTLPGLTMPLNTWTHIAGTFNGTNAVIYVNGVSQGTMSGGGVATSVAWNRLVIGGFNGQAQDAWIFSRALSSTEVGQLMNGGVPVSTSGLVGHWPLLAGGTSLNDVSGNGRTLTATGSVPDSGNTGPVSWNTITGTGQSSASGSGSASKAYALTGAGQSSTAGSATVGKAYALTGTGAASASGSANISAATALTGSGQTSTAGAAALSQSAALVGSGQSSSTGSGTVNTSSSGALDGTGQSSVAGAGSLSVAVARDGTGASVVQGSGNLSQLAAVGGSGQSSVAGSATLSVAYSLTGSGQSAVQGFGALDLPAPGGGGLAQQEAIDRRWLGALNSRRRMRR